MIHDLWYKDAVIYCLNVETSLDSNGDGIGDFPELTERLPYLASASPASGSFPSIRRPTRTTVTMSRVFAASTRASDPLAI